MRKGIFCENLSDITSSAQRLFSPLDKDKEALFNVAYNVTISISSRAILRQHNIFNRYLPILLYLPSTTPFYTSVSKGAFTPMVYGAVFGFEHTTSRPEIGRSTNWAIEAIGIVCAAEATK